MGNQLEIRYMQRSDGTIRAQQYADGRLQGAGIYTQDGQLLKRVANALSPWDDSMDDEIIETIKGFAPIPEYDAYLRYKDLPLGGRSRNYATGEYEAGVSVYQLEWDLVSGCWQVCGDATPAQMIINTLRGDVPAYIVTGVLVGRGADFEPLLSEVKIVGSAKAINGGWVLA